MLQRSAIWGHREGPGREVWATESPPTVCYGRCLSPLGSELGRRQKLPTSGESARIPVLATGALHPPALAFCATSSLCSVLHFRFPPRDWFPILSSSLACLICSPEFFLKICGQLGTNHARAVLLALHSGGAQGTTWGSGDGTHISRVPGKHPTGITSSLVPGFHHFYS